MKKYIYLVILLFVLFLAASCQSSRNLEKTSDNVILFGNGGGFAGLEEEYILDDKGSLKLKKSFKSETTDLPSIKHARVKKLFKQLNVIRFDTISHKHPGNVYYFIRHKNAGNIHEVVWGDIAYPVPPEIRQFYESLISATK